MKRLCSALILLTLACSGGTTDDPHSKSFVHPGVVPFTGDLDGMRDRGVIRVLVTPSATDFFFDGGQIRGIQAEYVDRFVKRLNRGIGREADRIRIEYVPVPFDDLLPALVEGRGDLAAAFLTVTEARSSRVAFSRPIRRSVAEVLVTHRRVDPPDDVEGLAGRHVYVLRDSSYVEHLEALDARLRVEGREPIDIEQADSRLRSEDLLEFVNAGVVDMTVVDDYKAELWSRVLDRIVVHSDLRLSEGNRVAWAVRKDSRHLLVAVNGFVRQAREGSLFGNVLLRRYFDDTQWLENPNASAERNRLERFLNLFNKYGKRHGFDPLALAAQAFQESGLDPEARSAAGAVGLMQILPSTAEDPNVDVSDIRSPDGNVRAGTRYLAFLRDRYFADPDLDPWDRRAFTWAAYNAGPKRIRRARALAAEMGLDPDVWFGNVEVATGRLAGREPVRYVANVHRYYVAYRSSWIEEQQRRRAADAVR